MVKDRPAPRRVDERLQKILSSAGVASRRKAEVLISEGRVSVNGSVIRQLGTRADPNRDHIKVDGRLVRASATRLHLLLNKPRGVVSTVSDPEGRPTVIELARVKERIYPVGRLDFQTEGLLLLTNDGEFARVVSRAGEGIAKVYHAKVKGIPDERGLERMRVGLRLADGTRFAPARVRPLREGNNGWYEVTLTQGRNLQVRRMFEAIGHPVLKLRRVAIGFLTASGLPVGAWRRLTPGEVTRLLRLGAR